MFVYTVGLGRNQAQNQTHFFFAGEHINNGSGVFIGMGVFDRTRPTSSNSSDTGPTCNVGFSYSLQYLPNYGHQEYYILGVKPAGDLVYGFSNKFVVLFDAATKSILHEWNDGRQWPNASFLPHAVDMTDNFCVIAGFVRNAENLTAQYIPIVYLLNFNASTGQPGMISLYQPVPTAGTWQDLLTNTDANLYSAKYDMSVSIDRSGNVLVGMQFINRVFLFTVDMSNPVSLRFKSRHTNGRSIGNGKALTWLDNGIAAILINAYSLDYQWSTSQVFLFDIVDHVFNSTTIPLSVFPNSHQLIPQDFSPIFLTVVSSLSTLALLDNKGKVLIFSATPPGYYPLVQGTKSTPYVTSPQACMPGAFKVKSGVHDCTLCPTGFKNPGNANTQCVACKSGSFCPLGSVDDIAASVLKTKVQVIPYPHSPESTIFDEILIHNMFTIGGGRCLTVSPLFWALIVAGVALIVIIIMEILKLCVKHPRGVKIRHVTKYVLKHTDLIGEGEFWVGGLVSFSIIILVSFAYAFSSSYLKQYPIEGTTDSYFACDLKTRNAKFDTNVQSLAIPLTHEEEEMFDLLNHQKFNLNIDFVNTLVKCDAVSIEAQFGLVWSTIRYTSCTNVDSTLTIAVELPFQHVSVRLILADSKTIGAINVGLSAEGHTEARNTLIDLHFQQSFSKAEQLLARTLPVALALSKVINETKPMTGEESLFGGIFIPTFTVDANSLFFTEDQYVRSAATGTVLTIVITETPYYVKNVQQPIARLSEVIFRNVLFTVVCLEIFGLIFLLYKLAFKPIYFFACRRRHRCQGERTDEERLANGDFSSIRNLSSLSAKDQNILSSSF